jgi:DNA-binding transcriptional regulator YiaG
MFYGSSVAVPMRDRFEGEMAKHDERRWRLASEVNKAAKERGGRLQAIRVTLHKMTSQRAFAAFLGVGYAQYNNWERGWPIPSAYLKIIVDRTPEITGDWLLWGYTRGISSETLARLQE